MRQAIQFELDLQLDDCQLFIEGGNKVYYGDFEELKRRFFDLIYIEHLNFYLFAFKWKIYRKVIDENDPYPYINLSCSSSLNRLLRYSKSNKKLIFLKDSNNLGVANLDKEIVEILVKIPAEKYEATQDFILFEKRKIVSPWLLQIVLII